MQGTENEPAPPIPAHSRETSEQSISDDAGSRQSVLGMAAETERHFVEVGPAWKSKLPAFRVLVHSPSKRSSTLTGPFTIYTLTSCFETTTEADSRSASEEEFEPEDAPAAPASITVQRRFSHFVVLHTALTRRLPGIALPPLPEKQYAGRFNDAFVEARRGDLERYINRVVRHPIARYAEMLTFFLSCESDSVSSLARTSLELNVDMSEMQEWKKQLPYYLALPPKGPSFYAQVYHPAFNVDAEDAEEALDRFVGHTHAVGKGVQTLRAVFSKIREARVGEKISFAQSAYTELKYIIEMSKAERLLSYLLLSLITSRPLASASPNPETDEDEDEDKSKAKGHMNEDGAWCWRENCEGAQHSSFVLAMH